VGQSLTAVSNSLGCFAVVVSMGVIRDRGIIGSGEASVLDEKLRAVNRRIENVKAALAGTGHAINFATYGYGQLADVPFRFKRRCDKRALLSRLQRALVATPRQPSRAAWVAEVHRNEAGRFTRRSAWRRTTPPLVIRSRRMS